MIFRTFASQKSRFHSIHSNKGFTIVELLVVVVVIGILAAIALVSYTGIQSRARENVAQSSVSDAKRRILAYSIQNNDTFPASVAAADLTDTASVNYEYSVSNSTVPKTYCVTVTINNTTSYYINNTTQTKPAAGGCPGHGQMGIHLMSTVSYFPRQQCSMDSQTVRRQTGCGAGAFTTPLLLVQLSRPERATIEVIKGDVLWLY